MITLFILFFYFKIFLFIFGKTSNSTKIVCEIANSLQKKVVHQDSNLTQKFGLRRVFCFLAYQAGKSARVACVRQILGGTQAPPPKTLSTFIVEKCSTSSELRTSNSKKYVFFIYEHETQSNYIPVLQTGMTQSQHLTDLLLHHTDERE